MFLNKIIEQVKTKNKYTTMKREPFFDFAAKYLPTKKDSTVLDLGCGDNRFSEYLNLSEKYEKNLWLLDGNGEAIKKNDKKYKNIKRYIAPNRIDFKDNEVDYVHCSHLIEHLNVNDFLLLIDELIRILKPGGILVISTPIDWELFYGDFSHVRPYPEIGLYTYLINGGPNRTINSKERFIVLGSINRYYNYGKYVKIGSENIIVEICIRLIRKIKKILKIKYYKVNGYSMALRLKKK